MKKIISIVIMVMLLAVTATAFAKAQAPKKLRYQKNACLNLEMGTELEITGTVVSIGGKAGLVIEVAGGTQVTIDGIGPAWYWEANNIDRPEIGETIIANVYEVPFSDATRNLAVSITILGPDATSETIQLRDPESGCPLWRGGKKHYIH